MSRERVGILARQSLAPSPTGAEPRHICNLYECYGDERAVDAKGAIAVSCDRCPWYKYVYPNEGIDVKQTAQKLAEDHVCDWKPVLSRFDLDGSCEPPDQRN